MTRNIGKISIELSNKTNLGSAFKNAGVLDETSVTALAVTGVFNHTHFSAIFKKMHKSLQELDLSAAKYDAYYISRGDYYYYGEKDPRYHQLWTDDKCNTLVSISFPVSVTELRIDLFVEFPNLTSITVSEDHPNYATENGILFNKDKSIIVRYPTGCKGEYVIPNSVVEIGSRAFSLCVGLQSVVVPPSVVEIGNFAFHECNGLTSIDIPQSTVEIGDYAFSDCSGLTSIVIPNSVKKVGERAFDSCKGLKSVKIINPAVKLGECAFYNCKALTALDMPKSVKYKQNRVFAYCEKLPLYNELLQENKLNEIKQLKIKRLKVTSAYEWIDTLMKNSDYPYKIIQQSTKLQLLVMINEKHKLVIPVPFKHFQNIVPKIMDTIQRFEAAINEFGTIYIDNMINDSKGWKIDHLSKTKQKEFLNQ